jgi:hypothetical protein
VETNQDPQAYLKQTKKKIITGVLKEGKKTLFKATMYKKDF